MSATEQRPLLMIKGNFTERSRHFVDYELVVPAG